MEEKRVLKPTVGRVVLYWPDGPAMKEGGQQPHAAMVAYVHDDRKVNLTTWDQYGKQAAVTSAVLRQPDDVIATGAFAEWMDYQVGQSAKTAEVEDKVVVRLIDIEARLTKVELLAHEPVPAKELVAEAMKTDEFREALAQAERDNPVKSG